MTRLLAAFVLAAALTACGSVGDPDPCDNPDGTCQNVPPCGEAGTCDGG